MRDDKHVGGKQRSRKCARGIAPLDLSAGVGGPPPPSGAPSLRPATDPLTPSASLNGIGNRR